MGVSSSFVLTASEALEFLALHVFLGSTKYLAGNVTVFDKTNYKSDEKDNTEKESYNQIVEKYKKLLGVSEVNWS